MASRMDVSIRPRIHIRTLRSTNDKGGERREEGGGKRSEAGKRAGIDVIVLESGIGIGNVTRGERAVETGIDATVTRGSIDEETTNGAVRLLPPTDYPPSRMDVRYPHRRELTRTRKKASKWSVVVPFSLVHGFFSC